MGRPVWERGRPPTEPVEIVERETPYKVTEYLPGWYDVQKNGKRISGDSVNIIRRLANGDSPP